MAKTETALFTLDPDAIAEAIGAKKINVYGGQMPVRFDVATRYGTVTATVWHEERESGEMGSTPIGLRFRTEGTAGGDTDATRGFLTVNGVRLGISAAGVTWSRTLRFDVDGTRLHESGRIDYTRKMSDAAHKTLSAMFEEIHRALPAEVWEEARSRSELSEHHSGLIEAKGCIQKAQKLLREHLSEGDDARGLADSFGPLLDLLTERGVSTNLD